MNVAFIPVRGGSKSIPLKNIKHINGMPLVYWTVRAACGCEYIDEVYVATDSDDITNVVKKFSSDDTTGLLDKVKIIGRSKENASDTASTESAMLEFAQQYTFENIVLIQATSPMLTKDDLNNGFKTYNDPDVDSVLSVVKQKRFIWNMDEKGFFFPSNYDIFNRPRRQEFEGYYVENGAFYITSKQRLLQTKNRISGHIRVIEMCEDSFNEIDEPSDWVIIEALMKKNNIVRDGIRPNIKMFLSDCDGCLTDGGMYYSEKGDEIKKFNTRDGIAFSQIREQGILTGIVTGENVELNRRRVQKLKLDIYEGGCRNKLEKIMDLCRRYDVSLSEVLYVGDETNDFDVIKAVGYSCCPSDAHETIKKCVNYVSNVKGGQGVIRDILDNVIMNER